MSHFSIFIHECIIFLLHPFLIFYPHPLVSTLKSAAQEARAMKEKAESDIAQEKRKAVNEVKNEIGGMAMEIAGKVIEREIKEEDHAKLIDEFISNVGEAS